MSCKDVVRYCPQCNRAVSPYIVWDRKFFYYSWARLELPYFLCGNCRTACVDKILVQKAVSSWRKNTWAGKNISHREAYQKAKDVLSGTLQRHVEQLGYRIVRFYKK